MPFAVSITRLGRRTLDVVLLLLIGLAVVTVVIARGIPAVSGGTTFVVGGGSMEPTIPLGSAVVTAPVAVADLAVGDVVSLRVGDQNAIFTHRIVRLTDRDGSLWLETQGDANTAPDPSLVPASAVIGRVSLSIPLAGYLVMVLGSIQGILFLVSLGVVVLAGAWLLEALEEELAVSVRRRAHDRIGSILPDPSAGQGAPG
ncbi:MAG: signal peptidase I [Chloroflexi bacterium]|nr:signal peptidase I [Chloroflexota bacterium]